MKDISIVVPVYNEAGNLPALAEKIKAAMDPVTKYYECILVDDGSVDGSFNVMKDLKKRYGFIKIVKLKRNFGQTQAMAAGFDLSEGKLIITMDADLQNDPEDIPKLIDKLNEGYDIVSGWRDKRKDPFLTRKLPSMIANGLISRLTGLKLHDFGCTLKVYKGEILKNIRLYGDMHRFIPAVASYSGIKIAEIRVNHHHRSYGVSKYGISRVLKVLLDLITVKYFLSFAENPMRLFGSMGFAGFLAGFASFFISIYMKLSGDVDITGNPIFYLTILFWLIGGQCILMGILGEMNVRIYHEMLGKQNYTIEEIL